MVFNCVVMGLAEWLEVWWHLARWFNSVVAGVKGGISPIGSKE